eukprot:scaffold1299_cov331-Prasinococcus_capsulatus_cf.AAC.3
MAPCAPAIQLLANDSPPASQGTQGAAAAGRRVARSFLCTGLVGIAAQPTIAGPQPLPARGASVGGVDVAPWHCPPDTTRSSNESLQGLDKHLRELPCHVSKDPRPETGWRIVGEHRVADKECLGCRGSDRSPRRGRALAAPGEPVGCTRGAWAPVGSGRGLRRFAQRIGQHRLGLDAPASPRALRPETTRTSGKMGSVAN